MKLIWFLDQNKAISSTNVEKSWKSQFKKRGVIRLLHRTLQFFSNVYIVLVVKTFLYNILTNKYIYFLLCY